MRSEVRALTATSNQSLDEMWFSSYDLFLFLRPPPAYLASVNAAWERAPMIYPRTVSDGQFYSPPESVAGDAHLSPLTIIIVLLFFFLNVFACELAPPGSEEDLDEEGLGRKAVTAQVAVST